MSNRDEEIKSPPAKRSMSVDKIHMRSSTGHHHEDVTDTRSEISVNDHRSTLEKATRDSSPAIQNGSHINPAASTAAASTTILSGMQFKITSRGTKKDLRLRFFFLTKLIFFSPFFVGNSATGEQQLVVTMELNGVQYEGVLFANPATIRETTAESPTTNNQENNHNSSMEDQRQRVTRPLISS